LDLRFRVSRWKSRERYVVRGMVAVGASMSVRHGSEGRHLIRVRDRNRTHHTGWERWVSAIARTERAGVYWTLIALAVYGFPIAVLGR
jgi:hypothetical protein